MDRKRYVVLLFSVLVLLKIIDFVLACVGIPMGAVEGGLLGFNFVAVFFNTVMLLLLGFIIFFEGDNKVLGVISLFISVLIGFFVFVLFNNTIIMVIL